MKSTLLILAYLAVVILPLALSSLVGGPPRPLHQELASGLGILAFTIIQAEFFLSGRFKRLSRSVGMDRTMRLHRVMACAAMIFALMHPFLYQGTVSGGDRPWDPTRQLTLTTEFSDLLTGIVAFLLLPCLVLFALFRSQLDYKYETWRLMHGVGAGVIALLLWHHTVYAGRYGSQPVLFWVWSVLTGISIASLLRVYLIAPLSRKRRPWKVTTVRQMTPKQWEVTVAPEGHKGLVYQSGQFAWLNLGHSAFSLNENPFSIASAPMSGSEISFMIKELGDTTKTVGKIVPGTTAYLDGPYGHMTLENRNEPGLGLIAGGIGIAPLLSILRQIRLAGDMRPVKIIYGNRHFDQIACRDELDAENTCYVLSEPPENWEGEQGLIDPDLIDRVFSPPEMRDWVFVMCGPSGMMDRVEDHLIEKGTPSDRILSERFQYD